MTTTIPEQGSCEPVQPTRDLLSCPFCGGSARRECYGGDSSMYRVICTECFIATGYYSASHGGDPSPAWNRRASSEAAPSGEAEPVVKALTWAPFNNGWRAITEVGLYRVAVSKLRPNSFHVIRDGDFIAPDQIDGEAEAKAFCQADFETRIRAALATPTQPASPIEQGEVREALAAFMLRNSFATGHGDTFASLLSELEWQVRERAEALTAATAAAVPWMVWLDDPESERICDAAAVRQWEASLKRPDLAEKDRVRGAIEAFKRQSIALTMLAASPSALTDGGRG